MLELCPPGTTVYVVLEHVSASGALRRIRPYSIDDNGPAWLGGYVETLCGYPIPDKPGQHGNVIRGGGMDMGFDLVYHLSLALYGRDGGYQLSHCWL